MIQDSAECYQAMVDDQLHMCYDDCGVMTSECYNLCVQKNMVEEHFRMAIDGDPRFIDGKINSNFVLVSQQPFQFVFFCVQHIICCAIINSKRAKWMKHERH